MGFGGHEDAAALHAVESFLGQFEDEPAGLAIGGQPGIGKTTLWTATIDRAEEAGIAVLAARTGAMETKLSYATLADLLGTVPDDVLACLPPVQRVAVDRVLLRGGTGPPTDERVAAAAFLSVLSSLSERSPVLVAIDDIQWLDTASRTVIGYATKRLRGRVGILVTSGSTRPHDSGWMPWLQLPSARSFTRIVIQPLSLGALHRVVAERLGCTLPRPVIARIHEISGGNPFFALELARTVSAENPTGLPRLPAVMDDVLHRHLEIDHPRTASILLALACLTVATIIELATATETPEGEVMLVIEEAETRDIVTVAGNQVRFAHPLLAHAVYSDAKGPQRRAIHRRLATTVEHPELRARHLALGSTAADEETLRALDHAAGLAARRGAPSAAAELFDMGLRLGDDDPIRRLRAAEQHFRSGSFEDAEKHLTHLIDGPSEGPVRTTALMLRGAVHGYRDGTVALASLGAAVEEADNSWMRVQAMLLLSLAHGTAGDMAPCVDLARRAAADANLLDDPALRSQALTLLVHTRTIYGEGIDTESLHTAMELEDLAANPPATLSARNVAAVSHAWAGDLERARTEMAAVGRRCREVGNEVDVVWAAEFATMIELWLGNPDAAGRIAAEALEDADLVGGHLSRITAMTCAAAVAAFRGRDTETARWAGSAVDAARASGLLFLTIAPLTSLAFLQTSRRQYDAALRTIEPLLSTFDAEHDTEIMVGGYLPDAIEALIAVGRRDEAGLLIAALETNGARVDRPWMRAMGARGRAALLAAGGELQAAQTAAEHAMDIHASLPMPFERARTQLLLGQVHRRRRHRRLSEEALSAALATFVEVDTPVWAARARDELQRTGMPEPASHSKDALTPAERRIAEHAAAGLSNREIAAQLFVSAKTVEMNLSRIYRKLGIRSRAQLHSALHSVD